MLLTHIFSANKNVVYYLNKKRQKKTKSWHVSDRCKYIFYDHKTGFDFLFMFDVSHHSHSLYEKCTQIQMQYRSNHLIGFECYFNQRKY